MSTSPLLPITVTVIGKERKNSRYHKIIELSHLKFDLTTQNRSIDIDDVCEIRPGKVSPLIDGVNIEDNDSLYVSIIASESILVLPVPSLVVRNNLIKRFQAFLMVSSR